MLILGKVEWICLSVKNMLSEQSNMRGAQSEVIYPDAFEVHKCSILFLHL